MHFGAADLEQNASDPNSPPQNRAKPSNNNNQPAVAADRLQPERLAALSARRDNPKIAQSRAKSSFKDEEATILPKPLFRVLASFL